MVVTTISDASTPSQTLSLTSTLNSKQTQPSTKTTPAAPPSNKPRPKHVCSRYLSPSPYTSTSTSTSTTTTTTTIRTTSSFSSSRRYTSPLLSRSTNSVPASSVAPKRSQSVYRRRPAVPSAARPTAYVGQGNASEVSAAAKLLITSTRRLSVSFQGEAFSLPISKAKKATPERRRTAPVRDRDQAENSKPVDQHHHRWPARARQGSSGSELGGRLNFLTRSVDCSSIPDEKRKLIGFGSGNVGKQIHQSMIENSSRRMSCDGRLSLNLGKAEPNSVNESSSDLTVSDSESVSGRTAKLKNGVRGIPVPAKFWLETNTRLRRLQDPASPLSTSWSPRTPSSKISQSKRFSTDSPSRTMASPLKGAMRSASPSKQLWSSSTPSPLRGTASPSRARPSTGNSYGMPSILSFPVDIQRGKMGEDRMVNAHLLRLVYNRYLQWRFVNARADAAFAVQRLNVEKNLWNVWVAISELRHSVTLKRMKLLLLKHKLKLSSILKGQIVYLEEWCLMEKDYSSSFLGATEALKASTLRLPVVGKATAEIQQLKDAVGSAVDVVHAMASSICSLSSKVEEMSSLFGEVGNVCAKEGLSLNHCTTLLSILAASQVKENSLRTHILQLNRPSF